MDNIESEEISESTITEDPKQEDNEISTNSNEGISEQSERSEAGFGDDKLRNGETNIIEKQLVKEDKAFTELEEMNNFVNSDKKSSHFINL